MHSALNCAPKTVVYANACGIYTIYRWFHVKMKAFEKNKTIKDLSEKIESTLNRQPKVSQDRHAKAKETQS